MWALCFVRFFVWIGWTLYYDISSNLSTGKMSFFCMLPWSWYVSHKHVCTLHTLFKRTFFLKHSSPSPYSTIAPIKLCFIHCNEFLEFFFQLVETFFFAVQRIRNWNFSLMHHLPLAMDNLILNFLCWFYTNHVLIALLQENVIWKKKMKYR